MSAAKKAASTTRSKTKTPPGLSAEATVELLAIERRLRNVTGTALAARNGVPGALEQVPRELKTIRDQVMALVGEGGAPDEETKHAGDLAWLSVLSRLGYVAVLAGLAGDQPRQGRALLLARVLEDVERLCRLADDPELHATLVYSPGRNGEASVLSLAIPSAPRAKAG